LPVQENKSFVWTHKITIKNADGWLRSEQERIISRIMEIYPCNNFHFIQRYSSHCETIATLARIKVWRTTFPVGALKATARISPPVFCGIIYATAIIQPSISATAQIGFVVYGNGSVKRDDEIEANGRIVPIIIASAFIDDRLHGTAKIVYTSEKVVCGNSRIVSGNYPIDDAQGNPKIGKGRGCDLKGDLPFTGWRLTRDGSIEHLVWYERGIKHERWVQKVTQIEIWFNPVIGDDEEVFRNTIEDLMNYYTFGNRRVDYISSTKFSIQGDYTDQLFKGMKLQINSPDFCCKLFNDQMQKEAYFKWLLEQYPYQVALSKINSTDALKGNAKINNDDLNEVTVIKSTFNGTNTVVEVSGEAIKNSDCLTMAWRERFDSVSVEKDYYPFSANSRIQAFLRTTGKIFWLVGPPNLPGNEEDYAYKILDVGE